MEHPAAFHLNIMVRSTTLVPGSMLLPEGIGSHGAGKRTMPLNGEVAKKDVQLRVIYK